MLKYKGYLIDLDGTMYRGKESIAGAKEFIQLLQQQDIPYMFITNNSTSTQKAVVEKLAYFGIETTEEQILTSAIAASTYIRQQQVGNRVYMIGEAGLHEALEQSGLIVTDEKVDYVIVGLDRQVTYEALAKACLLIRDGARFISTNKDAAIPTEKGLVPGNGALTATVTYSTGMKPTFIGKPEAIMMEQALQKMGLSHDNVLMVGDNYETDIMAGMNANVDTLMVLTGFSTIQDIQGRPQPTYTAKDLRSWMARYV